MAKSPRVETPRFAEQARVVLAGSEKAAAENAVHVKATPDKAKVTVSLIVKRKEPLKINKRAGRANGPVRLSRAEYKKHHTADPAALRLFSGAHPKVIQDWLPAADGIFQTDPNHQLTSREKKHRRMLWLEKTFGLKFNKKHYVAVD